MKDLLKVQKMALEVSRGHEGFGFFMEMGLGKTLVSYSDFLRHVHSGQVTRKVVVCPNSFKGGWKDEAAKWDLNVDVHIYESGNDYANREFMLKRYTKPPVLVVNYEAIRSENTQRYISRFIANRNAWITFDESIQLKNNKAAQTKAALLLAKDFTFRRILSGKPIAQGPHDLWGQMRAIGLLNGKNYYAFKTSFCRMGGYMQKQVIGAQNEDILAELLNPHVFRATKEEWTDIPAKLYSQREYQMTLHMRQMYRQMEAEFVLWLENGENVSVDAAITKYIKLAQITCGFIIREDGKVEELVAPSSNPRINLLRDIIENEIAGKVIVAYHHKYSLNMLSHEFAGIQPAVIQGGMSPEEIRVQQNKFNKDPDCRVLFAQIRATKYGFTLLGGPEPGNSCSTMIFFENTYSLDDRSQIEDRIHRHGQARSCLYVDLFGTPLDRNVNAALQRKEGIFQSVFSKIQRRASAS